MRNGSGQEFTRDAGFIRGMDTITARRQLHMSLGLVLLLALATLATALTIRIDPAATSIASGMVSVQAPQMAEVARPYVLAHR